MKRAKVEKSAKNAKRRRVNSSKSQERQVTLPSLPTRSVIRRSPYQETIIPIARSTPSYSSQSGSPLHQKGFRPRTASGSSSSIPINDQRHPHREYAGLRTLPNSPSASIHDPCISAPPFQISRAPFDINRDQVTLPNHEENIIYSLELIPPRITEDADNEISKSLKRKFKALDSWMIHSMLALIKKKFATLGQAVRRGMSLRAARYAAYLPNEFVTIGVELGSGLYGSVYLAKTRKGKIYVIKKEIISTESDEFNKNLRKFFKERNGMMLTNECSITINVRGSWFCMKPSECVIFTAMEYADFGPFDYYLLYSRPHMQFEVLRSRLQQNEIEQYITEGIQLCRDDENKDNKMYKGFRAIILRFAKEFIDGLTFLHEKGISHNDIHGENIMIGKGFHIKIIDFGLANINHPLYKGIFPEEEEESNVAMDLFEWSNTVQRDYDYYLEFLLKLSTGIAVNWNLPELLFRVARPNLFIPFYKANLYYDHFLSHFADEIEKLKSNANNPRWDVFIQNELEIFATNYGDDFKSYDVTDYVLDLYNDNNEFNENLESQMDVIQEGPDIYEELNDEDIAHLTGVGFLDESFLRENN